LDNPNLKFATGDAAHRVVFLPHSIAQNSQDHNLIQNLIISALVSVVFADSEGALTNIKALARSAKGSVADMPPTGTMTFMPRNAAPAAVNSTAPFDAVPVTMTVWMPLSLRIFVRSVLMNQIGVDELVGPGLYPGLVAKRGDIGHDVRRR
jgi:hypothetical protein